MATELSRRIKYAMAHLSRKQYTSLLARPNWRRIQRRDDNILPNPYGIRRAALRARASKRIKVMARPKHVSKKYDPETAPPSYPRIHPKTLEAKITKRILDLALPQKRTLLANMRFQTSGNITETLWKVQNSRYRRYRYFCNARLQREARKRQRILAKLRRAVKPEEWHQHLESMERLATPKVPPKPKPIELPVLPELLAKACDVKAQPLAATEDSSCICAVSRDFLRGRDSRQSYGKKKKWRRVNTQRLEELSTPVSRELPDPKVPLMVPVSALTYNITERMVELARHREESPLRLPPRILGTVSKAALTAEATPRLIILAKPAERPAGIETDLREDAFTVSPKALKARCSRRLKILARPKTYRK